MPANPVSSNTSPERPKCDAGEAGYGLTPSADPHSYILAPQNVSPGDTLMAGPSAEIKVGNAMPLSSIPIGQTIHNVEMYPGKGGQIARAAGTSATLISKGGLSKGPPCFGLLSRICA